MVNGMEGKPLVQVFADEMGALIEKYCNSGLTNAEAVGVLHLTVFDLMTDISKEENPF